MQPGDSTGRAPFPSTVWSEVLQPARLDALLRRYWRPVCAYIRTLWPATRIEDAQDLTQSFFAHVLEKGYLLRLAPDRGRFRGYLKIALRHFLIDAHRTTRPEAPLAGVEPAAPEAAYDQEWFAAVLEACLARLRAELERQAKPLYYEAFRLHCLGETRLPYREVAGRLGLKETDVVNYLSYARKLARRLLRKELEVCGELDADTEELLRTWATKD